MRRSGQEETLGKAGNEAIPAVEGMMRGQMTRGCDKYLRGGGGSGDGKA